jgi:signal peptidase II
VRRRAYLLATVTLVAVAALDQATKALAVAALADGDAVPVLFGIDLRLAHNTGVAFGVLADAGDVPIAMVTAVAVGALLAFFLTRADRPLLWLPVGMVLGGAAGNLIDRLRLGAVVDFIDPTFWPAFNLADTAIVVGVLGVLYVSEGPGRAREEQGDIAEGPGRAREEQGEPAAGGREHPARR